MWTTPGAQCEAKEEYVATMRFRYPKGVVPGNVIVDPDDKSFINDYPVLLLIFEKIIPLFLGILTLIVFFFIGVYFVFSFLRLFYLDTLKPYKLRILKALGKHGTHHEHSKKVKRRGSKKTPMVGSKGTLPSLTNPPGLTLSYTSPPMPAKQAQGTGDYLVTDNMPTKPKERLPWRAEITEKRLAEKKKAEDALKRLQSIREDLRAQRELRAPPQPTAPPTPEEPPPPPPPVEIPLRSAPASSLHTAIPKVVKLTWNQQLMILAAGPRKKATEINEIREKRKSGESGQGSELADTENKEKKL